MATVEMKKITAGFYVGTLRGTEVENSTNAVIKRNGGTWAAMFVRCDTGRAIRYAGIWQSLKEARGEVEHVASNEVF